MKYLVIFLALAFSAPVLADHKKVEVGVNGMVCDFCVQGIKKQFKGEESVTQVDVDLDNKLVTIHLKHELDMKDTIIKEKLKDAGYEVRKIARKED